MEWIEVATATTAGGTGIYMGARMAAASGVVKAVKRAVGVVLGSILAGVIAETKDWPNLIEILAGLNGKSVATIWKNPCLGVTIGQNAGLPTGQILRHCEQMIPATGDIDDSDRILAVRPAPKNPKAKKTVSEILADLGAVTEEDWQALTDAELQQVIDAITEMVRDLAAEALSEPSKVLSLSRLQTMLDYLTEKLNERDDG